MQPGPQFLLVSALCVLSSNLWWIGLLPPPVLESGPSASAALAATEAAEAASSEAAGAAARAEAASGAAGASCEEAASRLNALEVRVAELGELIRAVAERPPPPAPGPEPPPDAWATLAAGLAALLGSCGLEVVRTGCRFCLLPVPCPCRRRDGAGGRPGFGRIGGQPNEVLQQGRPPRRGGGVVR